MAVRVMECVYEAGQIGAGCGDEMDAGHNNHKEEVNSIDSHGMEDEDGIHVMVVAIRKLEHSFGMDWNQWAYRN
jgi:hypothetical protein